MMTTTDRLWTVEADVAHSRWQFITVIGKLGVRVSCLM